MAAATPPEDKSIGKPLNLHPAYTVTNIQNKVRILDGTKVTYSSWVKLFKLHARGYKVLDHIDGTKPPAITDPAYEQWNEIDAIVLQWIYGTLSDDLLVRVLDTDITAYDAWMKIQKIFLSNKGSRAAALEQEFSNLTLGACTSMDNYCQRLKDLADQLGDVDQRVNESRLVLQLVRGLPREYDTVGAFINQSSPSWDTARSMLQLEQHRQSARTNSQTVLAATSAPNHSGSNQIGSNGNQNSSGNYGNGMVMVTVMGTTVVAVAIAEDVAVTVAVVASHNHTLTVALGRNRNNCTIGHQTGTHLQPLIRRMGQTLLGTGQHGPRTPIRRRKLQQRLI